MLGSVAKYKVQAELDRFKLKSFQQRNVECSAMAGGERWKAIIAHEAITVNVFFSLTLCFRNRVLNDTSCPVLDQTNCSQRSTGDDFSHWVAVWDRLNLLKNTNH